MSASNEAQTLHPTLVKRIAPAIPVRLDSRSLDGGRASFRDLQIGLRDSLGHLTQRCVGGLPTREAGYRQ